MRLVSSLGAGIIGMIFLIFGGVWASIAFLAGMAWAGLVIPRLVDLER